MPTMEVSLPVWSVALCFAPALVSVLGPLSQFGLPTLAGNRADLPPFNGVAWRSASSASC